mmetsp:Transcript_59553/g.94566  ORF Transcript_59553/g.94566 Transcript_59553/m.94566 type:complete len:116 (-) Transcript_59553:126-473(-)
MKSYIVALACLVCVHGVSHEDPERTLATLLFASPSARHALVSRRQALTKVGSGVAALGLATATQGAAFAEDSTTAAPKKENKNDKYDEIYVPKGGGVGLWKQKKGPKDADWVPER